MAGLLQAGMNQQPQGQPPQQAMPANSQPQGAPQGGQQSPQQPQQGQRQEQPQEGGDQQAMIEALVDAMLNSLYEPEVTQNIEEILDQWEYPAEAMGRAIHDVMMITIKLIEEQGRRVPPEVMLQAGIQLARAVGEIAIEMGEVDEQDELAIEMGLFIAMAMVGEDMQSEQGAQYRQMGQQLAEQRMSMIDPSELDEETLALLQEQGGA